MKKSLLKRIALLLIAVLITAPAAYAAEAIAVAVPSDVAGTSYEQAVKALFEKEILTGDTDGKFYPDSNLTRAQACIIVVKTMNPSPAEVTGTATQPAGKSGFKDMTGYGWADGYIKYAVDHGVIKGYPDGTFKPGSKVTVNELITMVLRASNHTDESLGGVWPSNYITKSSELGLFAGTPAPMPVLATKGMAAQIDYNAIRLIEAANPPEETPGQGTDQDWPDVVPNAKEMTFTTGSFNSTMTTYDGKTIADEVVVYTYGEEKNYKSVMTFSNKLSDYREDTVYKYKNTKTPAFYKLENGKISEMIVPMDVGFTGRAFSVINKTTSTINVKEEAVAGISTLTAAKEITWLGERGLPGIPLKIDYLKGEIYQINLSRGEIQSIYNASNSARIGKFEEISTSGAIFVDVETYRDDVIKIVNAHGGALFKVKDNATVYILDQNNPTEYTNGRLSSIKAGVKIRAYDISDDDEVSADIVVIKK